MPAIKVDYGDVYPAPQKVRQQILFDEILGTVSAEVKRMLKNLPLLPVSSRDITNLILTPNVPLVLRSAGSFGESVSLRAMYIHGLEQPSYLVRDLYKVITSIPTNSAIPTEVED